MPTLVTIQIVTWNRKNELKRCLQSAIAQTHHNCEIVVVDNGSTDGTSALITTHFPQVRLVRSETNLGCPSGRNFGFSYCRGEYIYMLDDDGWLKEDAVELAVLRAEGNPAIGVVMSRIHELEGDTLVRKRPAVEAPVYQASFSGGCSLLRRSMLTDTGEFPDDFFRQAEECDLALRMLQAGFYCYLEPASVMYHAPSPQGRNTRAFVFYNLRNTNRTGLRLWPFPWCLLRPLVNFKHAILLSIQMRYFALPALVLKALLTDLMHLRGRRRPVSQDTFRTYRWLLKNSTCSNPDLRLRAAH